MKKSRIAFLCAVVFPMIFASCASKPKVETPAPTSAEPAVEETVQEEPAVEEQVNQDDEEAKRKADEEARSAALELYKQALEAKSRIDENGFASYSQADYDSGSQTLADFESKKDSDLSGAELLKLAQEANGKMQNVLQKAYKQLAKEARTKAFAAKKDADSVKAAAAAKEEYKKAAEEFKAGDTNYAMQNPEAALNHYNSSRTQFESMYATVSERRAVAQKAIDEAKAKVEAAQNYALNADQEKPLEEAVEGIEEEDAVLLEADNYETPESLEADIPEDISENADVEVSDGEVTEETDEVEVVEQEAE